MTYRRSAGSTRWPTPASRWPRATRIWSFIPTARRFPGAGLPWLYTSSGSYPYCCAHLSVYLTYLLALEVAPQRSDLALAAAALVAFNPMFLFISGSVNNDNLIVPLATLILWLVVRTLRQGWLSNGRALLLGFLLGLAALTKLSGLALLPLTAAVLVVVAARRRAWGALFRWGALIAVPVIAVAGWWYLRNWQLYGDPTGLNAMLDVAGRRPEPFTFQRLKSEFQGFRLSYWGVFGGFNVIGPQLLYWFYDLLMLVGLAGWIAWLVRRWGKWRSPAAERLLVLAAWVLVVLVALIRWTSQTYGVPGPAGLPSDRRHRRPGCFRPGGLAAPPLAGTRTGCCQCCALFAGRGHPVCGHPPGLRQALNPRQRPMCRRAHNAAT